MSSNAWLRAMVCLVVCSLIAGCDGAKLCRPCERQPETVKTEINHATFAFRFAPPWFNSDQRSLFTSYIVFPEEAKLEEWLDDDAQEGCPREDDRVTSSVCPDVTFYGKTMGSFLEGLSQCATTGKKVELHTVGFASSTGLNDIEEDGQEAKYLKDRYDRHMMAQGCDEEAQAHGSSDRFNLLIANERAANAAAMLRELAPKEHFDIEARYWCSHADMEAERSWDDGGDTTMGLMNRRAEVHVVACPAAWTSIRTVGRTD